MSGLVVLAIGIALLGVLLPILVRRIDRARFDADPQVQADREFIRKWKAAIAHADACLRANKRPKR